MSSLSRNLTVKQISVMRVIVAKNPDGSATDFDQIVDLVDYETNKASLHFMIRSLTAMDFVKKSGKEKRNGRQKVLISATERGLSMFGAKTSEHEKTEMDEALEEMLRDVTAVLG